MKIAAIVFLITGIIFAGLCTNYYIQDNNLEFEANVKAALAFEAVEHIRKTPDANERAKLEGTLDKDIMEWWALRPRIRQNYFYLILCGAGSLVSFAVSILILLVLVFSPRRKVGV